MAVYEFVRAEGEEVVNTCACECEQRWKSSGWCTRTRVCVRECVSGM